MNDETKLNCAGEFMSACDNSDPHLLSSATEAIGALAELGCEFVEDFADALIFSVQRARENGEDTSDSLRETLYFCHTYLAKAHEKKVGRA
jgi:hypothetical protein